MANWVVGTLCSRQFGSELPISLLTGNSPESRRVPAGAVGEPGREERFAEGLETVLDVIEARYFSAERYPERCARATVAGARQVAEIRVVPPAFDLPVGANTITEANG